MIAPQMPDIQGNSLQPGTLSYDRANNIYATSTYGKERNMNPGEILQPASIEDIQNVVRYASQTGKPIAIRTGGHQYSGACSTGPNGIQLDLKPSFRKPGVDLRLIRDTKNDKVYMRSSVSWTLSELFEFLKDNHVFLPTGQCATVCLGGHIQTGGYGMLARSFGLIGDYVRELEIVDYQGNQVKITKDSHPDLFYGWLGGSPGNMGVLTHFTVEVQQDDKHQGSKGLWIAYKYDQSTLEALLDILVEKAEDPNFANNYDIGINVVSREFDLRNLFPGDDTELAKSVPSGWFEVEEDALDVVAHLTNTKFSLIVVYAQWVNLGNGQYSPDLFDRIKKVDNSHLKKESAADAGMSKIASMWLFPADREYPYPYVKRTLSTNSTTLSKDGWSKWMAGRVNEVVSDKNNGLWISSQLQIMGGKNSKFWTNANNGTAYSWRKATITGTWDVFFQKPEDKKAAEKWQHENDVGARTHFSDVQYRLLWGSFDNWDMKKVWQHYYEPEQYKKLQQIRKRADPKGTFTPNPFCVEAAP